MLTPCVFDNWYTVKRREYKPCFLYSSNFLVMNVGCNLLWTNQVRCSADESCALLHSLERYIILIVELSGIYGNKNKPCPQAVALGLGWFTAINP